jgi:hypothetical protein
MQLRSKAFDDGEPIPKKYSGEGDNLSPPLEWSGVPDEAQALLLTVDDPDAPGTRAWTHWVAWNIPPEARSLPEGASGSDGLESEGPNESGTIGYAGPMPPPGHGTHHYRFRLFALDRPVEPRPVADSIEAREYVNDRLVGEAELIGTYERK